MSKDAELFTFVDRLLLLPLVTWRDAAMACPRQLAATAAQALTEAMRTPELALEVWNTRDDVETALCRFDCAEGRVLLRARGQREHVHAVSERAALAVLVHDVLRAQDFSACYGGFARCIALEALHLH